MNEFPMLLERDVRAESPEQVYQAVAGLLQGQGYSIRETDPPPAGASRFRGSFRAIRDTVLDADKRRQGYIMLAAGAAITLVMLVVYITELTTNRFLASAPLLPAVLLGGLGLSRLREPAQRVRQVVVTRFEALGAGGGLHLTVQAGVGRAEGEDSVSGWLEEGGDPALDTRRLDEVLGRFEAA